MANPRYAQQRPDRKAQKLEQYSQFQEGQQRQQALDMQSQGNMMEQLKQMYGLSQQQQMDPLTMDALRASTEAQGLANEQQRFQNQWAQPNAEAAHAGALAQAQYYGNRGNGQLTDKDFMDYEMTLGKLHPSDPRAVKAAQDAEAQRQQAILAEQAQQTGGAQAQARPATGFGDVGLSFGGAASDAIMDMPSTLYNTAGGISDFALGLLGVPPMTSRVHPYSAQRNAQRSGTDYGSAFYNPRDPVQSRPLPIAKERKKQ